jgi:TRAP-type C4-dicarboxylate transport system permease large subunit
MIIGGGIDMPYVGFAVPLLILILPLAVLFSWFFALKHLKKVSWEEIEPKLNTEGYKKFGISLFIPVVLVIVLMILGQIFPGAFGWGLPVVFLAGAASAVFVGNKFNVLQVAKRSVNDALPVMAILAGVGMFIQVMTLTGVRGFVVVSALSVNPALLYGVIGITMPLFGMVSSFGSASVMGVPFMLALLNTDQVITASALSLIAGLGDFMPPTALAAIFAAQVIKEEKYSLVLRKLIIPSIVIALWSLAFIIFSRQIRAILP